MTPPPPEASIPPVELRVECYAGYKADQEPRAFVLDGTRRLVLGIADRWVEPDATCFRVRADDGHRYLLRHDRTEDAWSLVEVSRADA